ncbi:NUDIX domain-containing protein [Flavobacteriaceae bacterium KMM 6897]|nr:NUDIX domain-containing protein [Flavobacteriaceae bacterium KMM 6897]
MNTNKKFIDQLSIDCVVFGYDQNQLKVLVPKLDFEGDFWTLVGGFILQEESIDRAAQRILEERTGIKDIFLEQYGVFGEVPRTNLALLNALRALNPDKLSALQSNEYTFEWLSQRFISIGYYTIIDINKVVPKMTDIDQSIDWYDVNELPNMILDHREQVGKALEALRLNLDNKLIGFTLLPTKFTMKELQRLYEAVYDKAFRRSNFQKKMLDLDVLDRQEKKFTGAANKAPYLYSFKASH